VIAWADESVEDIEKVYRFVVVILSLFFVNNKATVTNLQEKKKISKLKSSNYSKFNFGFNLRPSKKQLNCC